MGTLAPGTPVSPDVPYMRCTECEAHFTTVEDVAEHYFTVAHSSMNSFEFVTYTSEDLDYFTEAHSDK